LRFISKKSSTFARFFFEKKEEMSKFSSYKLFLKDLTQSSQVFDFELDDEFFKKINSPEVERGNVKATVAARQKSQNFELKISLNGYVTIPCDRCLDDMRQPINYEETLTVQFGEEFSEDGDVLIVPQSDGFINLAWFFYEMILVNIPIKHIHPPGECNKTMQQKLKKFSVGSADENDENDDLEEDDFDIDDENEIDPRWEKLKEIDND